MAPRAINERYLRVGYRRRTEGDTTPGGRSVMGRKGIGKLSLFSIADSIEIQTQANGAQPAGLKIASRDLRTAMETGLGEYNPEPVTVAQGAFSNAHGTRILASSLKRNRLREMAPESLRRLLADRDSLEASFYRDIVRNRLDIIKELQGLVDENHRERVLQKYLFDHLWPLDPAWERATGSEEMERRLRTHNPFRDDDRTKDEYGRVDIRYSTLAGKHVIVELKRASVFMDSLGKGPNTWTP